MNCRPHVRKRRKQLVIKQLRRFLEAIEPAQTICVKSVFVPG
jgi:hypothetical protein